MSLYSYLGKEKYEEIKKDRAAMKINFQNWFDTGIPGIAQERVA